MPQIKINRWLSTTVLTTAIAVSLMACQSTSTENTTKSEMNINKTTPLTVERIYKDNEFSSDSISRLRWLVDGSGWLYNGWRLQRILFVADGCCHGWPLQRVAITADGCCNGWCL